jgi:flagellar basal body rod protein FlgG
MRIRGRISLEKDGLTSSISTMILEQQVAGIIQENISGFNKTGFQRKVPVVSSFAEFLGPYALSKVEDDTVGRISLTKMPLDVALCNKGYFQAQTPNGIKLTRDGRFKLDKEGYLLTLEDFKVLSQEGIPIKFDKIPEDVNSIKVDRDGLIYFKDPKTLKTYEAGKIAAVSPDGMRIDDPNMKQGYVEQSNVSLQDEIYSTINMRRCFGANRELFKIQNESISRMLQELGKA